MLSTHPITRPVRTTEPTWLQEPIDLDQARHQCGIPDGVSDHDEALRRHVVAARRRVERDCAIVCYTGSFTWEFSYFPCGEVLQLPDLRPVTSITSIVYTATDGTSTTWTASEYGLEAGTTKPFVKLNHGYVWPTVRGDINGVVLTFVAGFASVAALPEEFRVAVLLQTHIQFLDSLGDDTAKMRMAYENHIDPFVPKRYA